MSNKTCEVAIGTAIAILSRHSSSHYVCALQTLLVDLELTITAMNFSENFFVLDTLERSNVCASSFQ